MNNQYLVSEIENLCNILVTYCSTIEKTVEIENILTLTNCLYEKIENLYVNMNNEQNDL